VSQTSLLFSSLVRCGRAFALGAALVAVSPATSRADEAPKVATTPPPEAPERSVALAVTIEVLSPVGGAGCIYRRSYVPGAIVMLGSLITGSTLIYAATTHDKDGAILNAVGYTLLRTLGIVGAARGLPSPIEGEPTGMPQPPSPSPREGAWLPAPAKTFGLAHAFVF